MAPSLTYIGVILSLVIAGRNSESLKNESYSPTYTQQPINPSEIHVGNDIPLITTETSTVDGDNDWSRPSAIGTEHNTDNRTTYPRQLSKTTESTSIITGDELARNKNVELWRNDSCAAYATCEYMQQQQAKSCQCDEQCYIYNDCCYDVSFNSTRHDGFSYECIQHNTLLLYQGVYVVTTCPVHSSTWTNCTTDDYSNIFLHFGNIEHWVIDSNGRIFINGYCAHCNGIFTYAVLPVEFLNVDINMFSGQGYTNMTLDEKMTFLEIYMTAYRIVIPDDSRRCLLVEPVVNATLDCLNYAKNPVNLINNWSFLPYRNIYCIDPEYNISGQVECIGRSVYQYYDFSLGFFDIYPLTVLFSFEEEPGRNCPAKLNGACPTKVNYGNHESDIMFSIVASERLPSTLLKQILLSFVWTLSVPNTTSIINIILRHTTPYNNTYQLSLVEAGIQLHGQSESLDELLARQKAVKSITWRSNIALNNTDQMIFVHTDAPNTHIYDEQYKTERWYFIDTEDLRLAMANINMKTDIKVDDVHCDEIHIDSSLSDDVPQPVFSINKVQCKKHITNIPTISMASQNTNEITYITYAGCSLSVITLSISIVICRKYHIINTVHGSNLENLSISLILANLLFLAGVGAHDNQLICTILGIILHYLWLTAFSFMSVAIIFLVKDIKKMSNQNHDQRKQSCGRNWSLTLLGLTLPMVLLAPAIVLQYLDIEQYSPHYGGSICFPTAFPANLIFVSGPIMVSVLTNTVCLFILIIYISRQDGQAKKLRKFNSFQQVEVYLRVSVITGIFWATGIISSVLKVDALDYIFVVTCSLQGFFIAIANITTRRMSSKMRGSFKRSTLTRSTNTIRRKSTITTRQSKQMNDVNEQSDPQNKNLEKQTTSNQTTT